MATIAMAGESFVAPGRTMFLSRAFIELKARPPMPRRPPTNSRAYGHLIGGDLTISSSIVPILPSASFNTAAPSTLGGLLVISPASLSVSLTADGMLRAFVDRISIIRISP